MSESRGSVLVVDDDLALGRVLVSLLDQEGLHAVHVPTAEAALDRLANTRVDLLLTDLRMPGMDGMQLLAKVKQDLPDLPVVMLTAHGTVPLAVEAMKAGASEFVLKPFEREELVYVLRKELTRTERTERTPEPAKFPEGLIGSSPAMQQATDLARKAAAGDVTVLIRGESGTGKEQLAKAIHRLSKRASGPMVKLHCAGLPDSLLESELFGYEKGAFTGAAARKPGRVELAQGGTLFLDEIGDTTPAMQVKLLRLLQEKEFERLGGTQTLKADVRFVAATHRPLEQLVKDGTFREDLFYRLNVVPIWLPPLRDRPTDVAALARYFVDQHRAAHRKPGLTVTDDAIARLGQEPWPGNVRELQNFLERLVVLSETDRITANDIDVELGRRPSIAPLPPPASTTSVTATVTPTPSTSASGTNAPASSPASGTLDESRRIAERDAVADALKKALGNRSLAARLLGVSRRTLYNKLDEFGLA